MNIEQKRSDRATASGRKDEPGAAKAYLETLKANGVDYLFVNPGTDFPPIVEAMAQGDPDKMPKPMVITHENVAISMAHGHAMVSGKAQAVILHVNVGTANAICGTLNARKVRVPLLLSAGRTPLTEKGFSGSRSGNIHWGQEMFDQGGMVREAVKWDYELRSSTQASGVTARALAIAQAEPAGPVYLTLPRETLAGPCDEEIVIAPTPVPAVASGAVLEQAADLIAKAKNPLIITRSAGRRPEAVKALGAFAERFAVPVCEYAGCYMNLSAEHPMHFGFAVAAMLKQSDLVIVLECDVPWFPNVEGPAAGTKVIHIADDPLYIDYPLRTFPADLNVAGNPGPTLAALGDVLRKRGYDKADGTKARRGKLEAARETLRRDREKEREAAMAKSMPSPDSMSVALGRAMPKDTIVVSEYWAKRDLCAADQPGSYFAASPAGGLGWGLGAALGAKLAAPDRPVVACLGDGSYLFANPMTAHISAASEDVPIVVIINNNHLYGAVRRATLGMYGQGVAAGDDGRLLADLPDVNFAKIAESMGAHAQRVEKVEDLEKAFKKAFKVAQKERRLAFVEVITA